MLFCSGLPLLLPIAVVSMTVQFWLDKLLRTCAACEPLRRTACCLPTLCRSHPPSTALWFRIAFSPSLAVSGKRWADAAPAPCLSRVPLRAWSSAVLRFCTRPPFYTDSLSSLVVRIMPWAVVAHLVMALWVLGNDGVLDSGPLDLSQVPGGGGGVLRVGR